MQPAKLHIVSYDVPYPPDYGGAIDLFYKIKSLSEAGCEIYLHCYEYGRGHTSELEKYCKAVWFYPRKTGRKGISLSLPYIVYSRRDKALLQRLQEIDAPILFEGIHTTLYLSHPSLKTRYKAVRTHNIEYQYYLQLSQKKNSFFAKTYLKIETALIRKYERKLYDANAFFELSLSDRDYFKEQYPTAQHTFLAPFHPYDEVSSLPGTGTYCLYHGNLSHPENREAVLFLLNEVFAGTDIPIVIAGKDPSKDVIDACNELSSCRRISNPSAATMEDLIQNAHIHILPTFQQSGMKLKLLSALFGGRHVLVNDAMVHGTGLQDACTIVNSSEDFINKINELITKPFTAQQIAQRREQLAKYNNNYNAQLLRDSIPDKK